MPSSATQRIGEGVSHIQKAATRQRLLFPKSGGKVGLCQRRLQACKSDDDRCASRKRGDWRRIISDRRGGLVQGWLGVDAVLLFLMLT